MEALKSVNLKRVLWHGLQPLTSRFLFPRFYSDGSSNNRSEEKGRPRIRQRKIASEVKEVLSEALQQGSCYTPVLQRCGFEIQYVKMSSDLRVAYVMWKALPGMEETAEKVAISKVRRLRSLVFERLNLPFSPTIKFQEDKFSKEELALEEAFAKLKESEDESRSEEAAFAKLKESEVEGRCQETFVKLTESEGEGGNQMG